MAYSQSRLLKTLAGVRILSGLMFLFLGVHKVASWEFAKVEFPQFVWDATHTTAVGFYGALLKGAVESHPSGIALLIGLTELFIGVGLVLGLAVRPISVVGMTYMLNLMLATWMAPGSNAGLWQYLDNEFKLIAMCFLFLLFGVGHAGECLGLGALYHRHRHVKWAEVEASQGEPEDVPKHDKTGERYLHDQIDPRYRMDGDDNARDRELSSLHSNLMP